MLKIIFAQIVFPFKTFSTKWKETLFDTESHLQKKKLRLTGFTLSGNTFFNQIEALLSFLGFLIFIDQSRIDSVHIPNSLL